MWDAGCRLRALGLQDPLLAPDRGDPNRLWDQSVLLANSWPIKAPAVWVHPLRSCGHLGRGMGVRAPAPFSSRLQLSLPTLLTSSPPSHPTLCHLPSAPATQRSWSGSTRVRVAPRESPLFPSRSTCSQCSLLGSAGWAASA